MPFLLGVDFRIIKEEESKMKKLIALLLVMIMAMGIFAGCNNTSTIPPLDLDTALPYEMDENGKVLDDYFDGVEIEWWFSSTYGLKDSMYLFQKLEEVIGCDIKVVCYSGEEYRVKLNAALNSNKLPNMCAMLAQHPVYNMYGDLGSFVNLLDEATLSRMPNFKKQILDNPECQEQLKFYMSEAGGLYGMVRYDTERTVNFGWMYREDIFKKHNIEMWTDSESFLAVARQLKQLYPESYPVGGASMESVFNRVCCNYGFNSTTKAYDWDTKTWYLGATDEGFYEMMKLFQTLYDEALLDPDCFNNGTNHLDEGVFKNESFMFNSWIGRMSVENTYAQTSPHMVDEGFHMAYAPHIGNGVGDKLGKLGMNGTVINAQKDPKEVEACMAIYNYLYSEEGIRVMTMGEEGVTYDTVDGVRVYKNPDGSVMANPTIQTLEEKYGLWNGSTYVMASKESPYFTYTPEEAEAQVIGVKNGSLQGAPVVSVAQQYANLYNDLSTDLETEIKAYCQKFIRDGHTREQWLQQCAEWEKNYGDLFKILNGTY